MSISYVKVQSKPTLFLRLFGMRVEPFEKIVSKINPAWQQKVINNYKRPGRRYDLRVEELTLMLFALSQLHYARVCWIPV